LVRYIVENGEDTVFEPSPAAYLVLIVNGRGSQSFPVRGTIHLGRDKSNGVVVADHKVSRHHATLNPIEDSYILTDLGSANGTYLNGVLISQPTRLKNQDKIAIGDTVFLFSSNPVDPNNIDEAMPLPAAMNVPVLSGGQTPALVTNSLNDLPIWMLFGCMGLVIIFLLMALAVLLGLLIGRGQATAALELMWIIDWLVS